jgi:thiol-disulfide isomerase/thioredoxin
VLGLPARPRLRGGWAARLTRVLAVSLWAGCAGTPSPSRFRADAYLATLATLPDVQGRTLSASSWSGRVLVVQFVATWCFPCIATAPRLQDLEARYGSRGLSVVAVGMDLEGAVVLGPFQEQLRLTYPVLVGNDALRDGKTAFGRITTLPTTVIVGRDGTVLAAFKGVPESGSLESFLEGALKQ